MKRIIGKLLKIPALAYLVTLLRFTLGGDKKKLDKVLREFAPERSGSGRKKLIKDIARVRAVYTLTPTEYFLFGIEDKTEEERKQFVSNIQRRQFTDALNKTNDDWKILKDKYESYLVFKPWYKRDVILVKSGDGPAAFEEFAAKHPRFLTKPLDAAKGRGIALADLSIDGRNAKEYFDREIKGRNCVAEEAIEQSPETAKFHPESVNTVRVVTWFDGEEVKRVFSVFRMGIGGSFVDNAGAGGIICAVDENTGIILTPAMKESAKGEYDSHPDTGEKITGAQLPAWDELCALLDEAARALPDQKWIGWDLAYSRSGWVIVEANQSPAFTGVQMCTGKGVRDKAERITGRKIS